MQFLLFAFAVISFIAASCSIFHSRTGFSFLLSIKNTKRSCEIALLIILFCLSGRVAIAKTYYFSDKNGNDSFSSTQAQNPSTPWKSLVKLNAFFLNIHPGDSILLNRGDVFRGSIIVTKSGTASSSITIGSYGTGALPVITLPEITGWQRDSTGVYSIKKQMWPNLSIFYEDGKPLLKMASSSDCTNGKWWCDYRNLYYKPTSGIAEEHSITVANIIPVSPGDYESAINLSNSSYITIDELEVDAYGIGVRSFDDKLSTDGLTVQNSVFNYCQRAILLMPNIGTNSNTAIRNCFFYRNQVAVNIYSALLAGSSGQTQGTNIGCKITDNEMSENGTTDGTTLWTYGTDFEAIGVQNFMNGTISNNYVHDGYQIGVIFYNLDTRSSDNNIVSNNRILNNRHGGLVLMGDNSGEGGSANYSFNNNVISNNLFVNSVTDFDGAIAIYPGKNTTRTNYFINNTLSGDANILYFPTSRSPYFTIQNNIFYNSGTYRFVAWRLSGKPANFTMDYNLYFEDNGIKNYGFQIGRTVPLNEMHDLGLEVHGKFVNPSFVNAASYNFHLQKTSPAIDAGVNVGLPFTRNAPDIGAYETLDVSMTPDAPALIADDSANTLSASHPLGDSVILVCENGAPYLPYSGLINVGNAARPAGYWKFKIKAAPQRNESVVESSPIFTITTTPDAPALSADDALNTLSASHTLGDSVILVCVNGAPYLPYTGPINVGNTARPAGYWKFKVKAAPQRNESVVENSPVFTLATIRQANIFRSKNTGKWKDLNSWEFSSDSIVWNNATKVPAYIDNTVTIQQGDTITIDNTVTIDELRIEDGGILQVAPKGIIIANDGAGDDIRIASLGAVIVQSDSTGSGIIGNSSGTIAGAVIIERYIPAKRAWCLLTAPVTANTKQTINEAWQEGAISSEDNPHPGYGTHITGGAATNGFDQTLTNSSSIRYYDKALINLSNTKVTTVGQYNGYFLFVRGSRDYDLASTPVSTVASATTLRVKGELNQGAKSLIFNNPAVNQFFLAGNPYAAPVDFATIGKVNLKNTFWAWDSRRKGTSSGGYVTVSWDDIEGDYDIDYSDSQTAQTRIIQSGQAVLMQAQEAGINAAVTFNETDKTIIGNTNNVFRGTGTDPTEQLRISLSRNTGSEYVAVDGVLAKFGKGYSSGTEDDAVKLNNYDETLSLKRNQLKLSIERRPLIVQNDTLFLNIDALKANTQYNFEFDASNFNNQSYTAILVDKFLGLKTPLSLTRNTIINFTTEGKSASSDTSRFMIVFKSSSTLPLTFTGIKAWQANSGVQVEWNVESETGVQRYIVEKSADLQEFTEISFTSPSNNNTSKTYRQQDDKPFERDNFYRIKIVRSTGAISYSSIVKVRFVNGQPSFRIYSNPIKDKKATMQLLNVPKGEYSLTVYDQNGGQVLNNTIHYDGILLGREILLPTTTASGTYHIVVRGVGNNPLTLQETVLVQ